jgi:hypothetical protein
MFAYRDEGVSVGLMVLRRIFQARLTLTPEEERVLECVLEKSDGLVENEHTSIQTMIHFY